MPDRYFSSQPIEGSDVELRDNEAHHLLHVMRAKPGLELVIFDGLGGEFAGEVVECRRSTILVRVGERQPIERELPFDLTLMVALPKGERQRWLIEKCVELGIAKIIPLQTSRAVNKSEKSTKLRRYVIEASKQCGRNQLMEITEPQSLQSLLTEIDEGGLIAHPGGCTFADLPSREGQDSDVRLAVGPEGGFTDDEVAQAESIGWKTVGLGDRILRVETASLALASHFAMR